MWQQAVTCQTGVHYRCIYCINIVYLLAWANDAVDQFSSCEVLYYDRMI